MRIAGAQIPVGTNIQANKKEIFKAIDWAKDNECDHIITPECALSGWLGNWVENFDEILDALKEVENHQKAAAVGLHLGTNFIEDEPYGRINRNEIRYYNALGILSGKTYKTHTIGDLERVLYRDSRFDPLSIIDLSTPNSPGQFIAGSMICNDMWGASSGGLTDHHRLDRDIPVLYKETGMVNVMLHATNGRKWNTAKFESDFEWEIIDVWHNAHLRMASFAHHIPIFTVDSCTEWDWDGDQDTVNDCLTSSQSGVLLSGSWMNDVPRKGCQYFKYDFKNYSERPPAPGQPVTVDLDTPEECIATQSMGFRSNRK